MDPDQIESQSVEIYPVDECHYRVLISEETRNLEEDSHNEEETITEEQPVQNITIWNHTETLALINIFSLYKDKFKDLKKRKDQWKLISDELAKIGIHKAPEKCEIKWKNLLRVYRQYKTNNRGHGKFEFFNELDHIVSNDWQYRYLVTPTGTSKEDRKNPECYSKSSSKKRKCSCLKSDKQKRHDDRMTVIVKKMEIEERKVKAFEDYLQFLKSTVQKT